MWKEVKTKHQNSDSYFFPFSFLSFFHIHRRVRQNELMWLVFLERMPRRSWTFPQGQLTLSVRGWCSSLPHKERRRGALRQTRTEAGKLWLPVGTNKNSTIHGSAVRTLQNGFRRISAGSSFKRRFKIDILNECAIASGFTYGSLQPLGNSRCWPGARWWWGGRCQTEDAEAGSSARLTPLLLELSWIHTGQSLQKLIQWSLSS